SSAARLIEVGSDSLRAVQRLGVVEAGLTIAIAAAVTTPTASAIPATITTLSPFGAVAGFFRCAGRTFENRGFAVAVAAVVEARSGLGMVAIGIEVGSVSGLFHEIGDVEEGVALKADVHEAGLHARQDAGNATVVDGTCESVFVLALVIDFS